jgi:multidrug efflux system outer membrane protein
MSRRQFTLGTPALLVPGRTVGPEITSPTMRLAGQFDRSHPSSTVSLADAKWWTAFGDSTLNGIVEIGLQQNLDIRRAVARIKSAEGASAAAGYPISGAVRIGESKISGDSNAGTTLASGFARAEASWRLDLFGKLENERKVGRSNLDAAYEDADIWRLTLISDIISAYIDLRFAQELIRITKRVNESRRQTLKAAETLFEEGKASEIAVAQAKALLATSRASMPDLKVLFDISLNRIVTLLGVTELPNLRDFDKLAPQPTPRSTVVRTGVPAGLIRHRPDIRRAERRLASALAAVGVATADLYPELVLTGNIALNLSSTSNTINAGFFRLGFDLPIFDRPARKGRVQATLGIAEERRAEWEKEVVLAVEEVRNGIYALRQHQRAERQATLALSATRDVLEIAGREFVAGNIDFFQVQDAERSFLSSETALAQDRRNVAIDFVSLNVALGGRYSHRRELS